MGTQVNVKNANLSFPHLLEKHKATNTSKAVYSAELLLRPDNPALAQIEAASRKELAAKFGPAAAAVMEIAAKRGEDINAARIKKGQKPRPEIEGMYVLRASDDTGVLLAGPNGKGVYNTSTDLDSRVKLAELRTLFTPGAVVNAIVEIYAFKVDANRGCTAGLSGIQLVRNTGEGVMALGGKIMLKKDVFAGVEAGAGEDDAASFI